MQLSCFAAKILKADSNSASGMTCVSSGATSTLPVRSRSMRNGMLLWSVTPKRSVGFLKVNAWSGSPTFPGGGNPITESVPPIASSGAALAIDSGDPTAFDDGVDAAAARQARDLLGRIGDCRINDFGGAHLHGGVQSVRAPADNDDLAGIMQSRGRDRAQADRAGADDRHGLPGLELGVLDAEVAGGQHVGDEDRILVADLVGNLEQRGVRERGPDVLREAARHVAEGLTAAEQAPVGA